MHTAKHSNQSAVLMWMMSSEVPVIMQLKKGVNHMLDENDSTYIIMEVPDLGTFKVTIEQLELV